MDSSSARILNLLPLYPVVARGTGVLWVGIIESVGRDTAPACKVVSERLSDGWGRRKPLAVAGCALSAASMAVFSFTPGAGTAATRFAHRVRKGLRESPGDALLTERTPKALLGVAIARILPRALLPLGGARQQRPQAT